ncbi:MAG TPA: PQQ-binding-like beta-propeller repeat protein [Terriglobia bacterium]|nr:PQQ-binding-like beta-propeller repeat protein [Terriglobia bacterium]
MRIRYFAILAAAAMLLPILYGQTNKSTKSNPDADWPMYNRDLAGTRYSPLTEINAKNVTKLTQAWSFRLGPAGPNGSLNTAPVGGRGAEAAQEGDAGAAAPAAGARGGRGGAPAGPTGNPEATPIVVNGVMYLPAGRRVLALDAETGKEIWTYTLPTGNTTARGVAYWPGEGTIAPRIMFTSGPRLVAVNAITGEGAAGFGKDGFADISVGWNGVPLIFKNVVMLGATVGEMPQGPPGDSRGFDARTGEKLWDFHTIPQPGEVGHDTWLNDGWQKRSGTNVWGWYLTMDDKRGILYMPVGSPAPNYWGGDRPGNNLFGNSVVAVDAQTGKYKWHFQTVHHDLWDSDLPPAPVLIDIKQKGKTIPALAQIGKQSWMFILNRETGEPIFGVEERPVPAGDVPGEWYSPTQPFPLKPPPLARTSFSKEDMVTADDTTPEHAKACQEIYEKAGGFYNAGPFTPFLFHEDGTPPRSTIIFPGNGGPNWGGMAADPKSGYVFVQTHDAALSGWVEKKREGGNYGSGNGSTQPYDRGAWDGPGPYHGFAAPIKDAAGKTLGNAPCQKPPWGRLWAVNANTGDIAWQVPLGLNEALPPGKQSTGGSGSAGPIVTAGGLVFIGATNDSRFRAFDSKTGKELWATKLERPVNANPMTYQGKNGKQYVATIATDSVVVFVLP